jgi:hypothetical protein
VCWMFGALPKPWVCDHPYKPRSTISPSQPLHLQSGRRAPRWNLTDGPLESGGIRRGHSPADPADRPKARLRSLGIRITNVSFIKARRTGRKCGSVGSSCLCREISPERRNLHG